MTADKQDEPAVNEFLDCAHRGDLPGMRALVEKGLDLNRPLANGEPLLCRIIWRLQGDAEIPMVQLVREMLHLGADARQLDAEGYGPLTTPMFCMDTEVLRVLLEAGSDPNVLPADDFFETLYDLAEFDYCYEIWDHKLPSQPAAPGPTSADEWLAYLDRIALQYGKRRPDYLFLLRQHGALTLTELLRHSGWFAKDETPYLNRFELRLGEAPGGGMLAQIWIDGCHLDEPHAIDPFALVQSLHQPRQFDIFTCGCGIAGCAGIPDGIEVSHCGELIHWAFRRPQSAGSLVDPELNEWERSATWVHRTFARRQMCSAIQRFQQRLRERAEKAPAPFIWPVNDICIRDVLNIDVNAPVWPIE